MEINDLREFDRPCLRRWESRVEEKRQSAIATQGTQGTKGKNPLSLCPFAAFGGQFIAGFPWPLSPLQIFKEQAPERLTYSTLPRFDGNARTIIQVVSGPARGDQVLSGQWPGKVFSGQWSVASGEWRGAALATYR
jgi:hypothetical protein